MRYPASEKLEIIHLVERSHLVLLRFSGELIAHSRPAISKWTGLW